MDTLQVQSHARPAQRYRLAQQRPIADVQMRAVSEFGTTGTFTHLVHWHSVPLNLMHGKFVQMHAFLTERADLLALDGMNADLQLPDGPFIRTTKTLPDYLKHYFSPLCAFC